MTFDTRVRCRFKRVAGVNRVSLGGFVRIMTMGVAMGALLLEPGVSGLNSLRNVSKFEADISDQEIVLGRMVGRPSGIIRAGSPGIMALAASLYVLAGGIVLSRERGIRARAVGIEVRGENWMSQRMRIVQVWLM